MGLKKYMQEPYFTAFKLIVPLFDAMLITYMPEDQLAASMFSKFIPR